MTKRDLERKAVGSPVFSNSSGSSSAVFRRSSMSTVASTNLHLPLSPKLSLGGLSIVPSSSSSLPSPGGDHRKLDRSMSEPSPCGDKCSKGASAAAVNSSRYKTELCRPFEENGSCKYGDKCQFAHGEHELRNLSRHPKYKTELCRTFHTIGFCPYGPRCHFIHNAEESRKSPPPSPVLAASGARPTTTSLGSTGDPSPPSSLSESPTSLNTFSFRDSVDDAAVFSPSPPASTAAIPAHNAFSFSHDFATLVSPTNTQINNNIFSNNTLNNSNNNKRLLTATMSLDRYNNNRNTLTSLDELDIYDNLIRYPDLGPKSSGDDGCSPIVDSLVSELDNLCMSDSTSIDINRGCGISGSPMGMHFPMLNRMTCSEE